MANEKRLIDANKLYDKLEGRYKRSSGWVHKAFGTAIDDVCEAPTVDAVEVVRCKDCRHWRENWIAGVQNGVCIAGKPRRTFPYDFCSYGERREGE